jgi:hypothetical protein
MAVIPNVYALQGPQLVVGYSTGVASGLGPFYYQDAQRSPEIRGKRVANRSIVDRYTGDRYNPRYKNNARLRLHHVHFTSTYRKSGGGSGSRSH